MPRGHSNADPREVSQPRKMTKDMSLPEGIRGLEILQGTRLLKIRLWRTS
jgi:hypothetical protein